VRVQRWGSWKSAKLQRLLAFDGQTAILGCVIGPRPMLVKSLTALVFGAALYVCADPGTALAWGCRIFDGSSDLECLPHPDYVTKRVNFFCGDNTRRQFSSARGDCRRDGIAFNLRQFTYRGVPAVKWNIQGRKSRATLATGCYCVIDE
jgi:hypothetical protein